MYTELYNRPNPKQWLKRLRMVISIILLTILTNSIQAQDRFAELSNQLQVLATEVPGLDKKVDLSASKMPIQEFFRTLAVANKLNITVDPTFSLLVSNTFSDISVQDILVFMCREYSLEIVITGRIISIGKYIPPKEFQEVKPLIIKWDSTNQTLSMDLQNDSLLKVIREITRLTGQNVIFTPDIQGKLVSIFVRQDSLNDALEKMAISNNLAVTRKDDFFVFYDESKTTVNKSQPGITGSTVPPRPAPTFTSTGPLFPFQAKSVGDISLNATGIPIADVINTISPAVKVNYFIYSELKEPVTVNLAHVTYEELLENIMNGTKYSYRQEKGIYLIGDRDQEGVRGVKVIKMKYRSVTDLGKVIPDKLKKEVTIQEFPDLNSLILSGSSTVIREIGDFLSQIDEVVPLVLIEVIIINFQNGYTLSTGLSAGIGDKPVTTTGTVGPGVDITLGASSINSLISSLNGAGLFNLGKVTPNFYISLKLLEDQGVVKVRSTPKLSTLNGHEAIMKISKTEYYLEETSQIFANASTTQTKVKQYKPVNADFSIIITPLVSADEQITMQVKVDQSDFTGGRLAPDAPPNQVSRSFTSLIRVRNEEMILLGGLDEGTMKDSGSGIPVLSRIPILKWIFSSRNRVRNENKLSIFIKPTIIF